jgi:hypothetical protein
MNQGPNLWWVYDSEQQSFSTLPTGPFLVPALFICGLTVLWRSCFDRRHTVETIAGKLADTQEWQAKYKRYRELIRISTEKNGDFTLAERYEYEALNTYLNNPYGY